MLTLQTCEDVVECSHYHAVRIKLSEFTSPKRKDEIELSNHHAMSTRVSVITPPSYDMIIR